MKAVAVMIILILVAGSLGMVLMMLTKKIFEDKDDEKK